MDEYQPKSYFRENEDDEVTGFIVVEVSDTQYRIAEKWTREDAGIWTNYWVSKEGLTERLESGACEFVKEVTDEQFEQVLRLAFEARGRKVPA